MQTAQDEARAVVRATKIPGEFLDGAHYANIAVDDYDRALRYAKDTPAEVTVKAVRDAYVYAERSISMGFPAEEVYGQFALVRDFWSKEGE